MNLTSFSRLRCRNVFHSVSHDLSRALAFLIAVPLNALPGGWEFSLHERGHLSRVLYTFVSFLGLRICYLGQGDQTVPVHQFAATSKAREREGLPRSEERRVG